jgi:hypothetical protein
MFGPLTLIARDPLVLLLLALAVLGGLTLHNVVQALLARRLGDNAAADAGFTSPEPPVHHSLVSLLLYLLLGLALPRPVPVKSRGWRAAVILLSGPLTLLLTALLLLLFQRLQQLTLSSFDPLGQALGRAAYGLTQHSVFFLLPLPALDMGRTLKRLDLQRGVQHRLPASLRSRLSQMQASRFSKTLRLMGPLLTYLLWLLLALSGTLNWATEPLWKGLGVVVSWLP